MEETIKITPVDGKNFRWTEGGMQTVVLHERCAFSSNQGWVENAPEATEDDDAIEALVKGDAKWKVRLLDFIDFALKKDFGVADMFWDPDVELFTVDVEVGRGRWRFYFGTRSEAIEVQKKFINWILS